MTELQQLKKIAEEVGRQNLEVMIIYVYGSLVEGYFTDASDIDLAVVIDESKSQKSFLTQLTAFSEPFEKVFGEQKIDLHILNDAPLTFKYTVIQKGEILFSRDIEFQENFETPIRFEYWDFKPYLDEYFEVLLTRLSSKVETE